MLWAEGCVVTVVLLARHWGSSEAVPGMGGILMLGVLVIAGLSVIPATVGLLLGIRSARIGRTNKALAHLSIAANAVLLVIILSAALYLCVRSW